MIEAFALFMLLGSPPLESKFEGTVFDTNGSIIKMEVSTRSFVLMGRIFHEYSWDWEGVEGTLAEWAGFGIGVPSTGSSQSARWDKPIVIRYGDFTVERNGVAIFRMPAPTYDWKWSK